MSDRVQRLVDLLPAAEIDVMLVTSLTNVRYLTGYTGSNGLAVVGPETRSFVTDFRYVQQASEEVDSSFERIHAPQDLFEAVADTLPAGSERLGFEDAHLTVRAHARLAERLGERVELIAAGSIVERLRAVKSPEEIELIRRAAALADAAFEQVIGGGVIGRTERELALALEGAMLERGTQRPSFDTIVAAGSHGALPHAQRRDVKVQRGQMVVIDWGADLDGYCSDCTRTIAAGEVDQEAREIYQLVLEAQLAGLEAISAGASARAVDGAARQIIDDAGHGEHFGHGLGHGVGLDIHEAPTLSRRTEDQLERDNVVTVEPGIYLPGRLGVRIEDLVAVTDDGCEILNSLDKQLLVVD